MDKLIKYRGILLKFMENYVSAYQNDPNKKMETQIIADTERDHYQILRVGWQGSKYFHYCLFHFDIKNGKIWIQKNNTEELIGDELVKMGIPREDIILGFQPEDLRVHTGFGVN
ncbi:MAG: XisI protein [Bacteroidetes bacterium]|nr:XisI protein [Bacteroidota bacterium]MCB0847011.1 XisI protein [Bacteroidota bacterium]